MKTALITILLSFSALAQIQQDSSVNPGSGFGTSTTPGTSQGTGFGTTTAPTGTTTIPNTFPEEQEENNFAGGALGGAAPGTTVPGTPGAISPGTTLPGSTAPGVAPTSPNLPGTGVGTGSTSPGSTSPATTP